jgi:hypothetical protein
MHFKELLLALAASATVLDGALAANSRGTANNGNTGNAIALALNPQLVQKASESTGGAAAGQAASATYALCPRSPVVFFAYWDLK